jgi:hypothetical protein
MNENSRFWTGLETGWNFIENGFRFLNNKKTKIGVALSILASYWLGVDQIVSTPELARSDPEPPGLHLVLHRRWRSRAQ